MENAHVWAVIVPALGGRVWELVDRARMRQWIWHRHDVALARSPSGACYDDVWAGGWEELFPNDARGDFEGRSLPDHGEWWTTAWEPTVRTDEKGAVVSLTAETRSVRASCVKEFSLARDASTLRITYRIRSAERTPFHFLFKQHLPVAITADCRLALPGGTVTVVDPTFGTLLPETGPFAWPLAAGGCRRVDLARIPEQSDGHREFIYVADLPEGWCGIDDHALGASLRLRYDRDRFPFVWLFLAYGGWRGCYTAVLEPCTNMPKDLPTAVRLGQSAELEPGAVFETSFELTVSASGPLDR